MRTLRWHVVIARKGHQGRLRLQGKATASKDAARAGTGFAAVAARSVAGSHC